MKPHDDAIEELIPWVANGTASEEERRSLEGHLPSCEACRALLDQARALAEPDIDKGDLPGHPPAALLIEMADAPDRIPQEARARLEQHLRSCPACESALAAAEAIPTEAGEERGAASLWSWMTRTFLSPALALAYLLVIAVGLAWISGSRGPSRLTSGGTLPSPAQDEPALLAPAIPAPGEITFREAPPGGEGPSLLLDPPAAGEGLLHLRLETDIDEEDLADPGAAFEIRLVQGGSTVWSRTVRGTAFDQAAAIALLLPATYLEAVPATRIEILLDRPGDPLHGKPLYVRTIALRPGP